MAAQRYDPRHDPFHTLADLQRDISRLLQGGSYPSREQDAGVASDWIPAVDIREEIDRFVILADVPGVQREDIEITMDQGALAIKGVRAPVSEQEASRYSRMERVRGTFFRRFSLPDTADAENISARSENGVLQIAIPKQEKGKPRRIQVQG